MTDTRTPLRVLLVDDSELDAALALRALGQAGYTVVSRRVDTEPALIAALDDDWDIVLSDFQMPRFGGREALQAVQRCRPGLPFVLVSGAIGEDMAVEMMKAGADDYVMKDRLARLGQVVARAIRDGETRRRYRATERELRKMALVVEQIPSVVIITDLRGLIEYVNPRFTVLTGYTAEEVIGRHTRLLKSGHTAPETYAELWRTVTAGREWRGEFLQRRKDGTTYRLRVVILPIRDADGRITNYLEVGEDVTAQHALEQQFRQAQKMEAVGRLAGGVAHDFNNLLTVISGFTQMAIDELPPGSPMRQDLEQVAGAGERGASLTRQLLAFSRKQPLEALPMALGQVVRDAQGMVQRLVGEDIVLSLQIDEADPGPVLAEPGQLEQILMNLVVNARDAMPTGGRLTISSTGLLLDEEQAATHTDLPPGQYVVLTVRDTGHGMTSDTIGRIFEPFFTTKEIGQGSGLGLSTVYGIVTQLRGAVEVTSTPGEGSTFRVLLPVAKGSATRQVPSGARENLLRGNETILVVDDEPAVAHLAERTLGSAGYTVLTATSAGEALLTSEKHHGTIHLLLTDVIMPRMSGRELADRLVASRPDLRVLYTSGYTDDILSRAALSADRHLIRKPFLRDPLLQKVREALDQGGTQDETPGPSV